MARGMKLFKIILSGLIFLNCCSCAYVGQSYKSHRENVLSEPFPFTPKAFDRLIHPSKLFNKEDNASQDITKGIIYPLMVPGAAVMDAWCLIGYPIAPLYYWMYYFSA